MIAEALKPKSGCKGAATLLCLLIFIPLLFFLLVASIEIHTYFDIRAALISDLDQIGRYAMRNRLSESDIKRHIKDMLGDLNELVESESIAITQNTAETRIAVDGAYRGELLPFLSVALGIKEFAFPFEYISKVRKLKRSVIIIFDRYVSDNDLRCDDPTFTTLKEFISGLYTSFKQSGVRSVKVGVFPALNSSIAEVNFDGVSDLLERCKDQSNEGGSSAIRSISGINGDRLNEFQILDGVRNIQDHSELTAEKKLVVVALREDHIGSLAIDTLSQLLELDSSVSHTKYLLIRLQNNGAYEVFKPEVLEHSLVKTLVINDSKLLDKRLLTAIAASNDLTIVAE